MTDQENQPHHPGDAEKTEEKTVETLDSSTQKETKHRSSSKESAATRTIRSTRETLEALMEMIAVGNLSNELKGDPYALPEIDKIMKTIDSLRELASTGGSFSPKQEKQIRGIILANEQETTLTINETKNLEQQTRNGIFTLFKQELENDDGYLNNDEKARDIAGTLSAYLTPGEEEEQQLYSPDFIAQEFVAAFTESLGKPAGEMVYLAENQQARVLLNRILDNILDADTDRKESLLASLISHVHKTALRDVPENPDPYSYHVLSYLSGKRTDADQAGFRWNLFLNELKKNKELSAMHKRIQEEGGTGIVLRPEIQQGIDQDLKKIYEEVLKTKTGFLNRDLLEKREKLLSKRISKILDRHENDPDQVKEHILIFLASPEIEELFVNDKQEVETERTTEIMRKAIAKAQIYAGFTRALDLPLPKDEIFGGFKPDQKILNEDSRSFFENQAALTFVKKCAEKISEDQKFTAENIQEIWKIIRAFWDKTEFKLKKDQDKTKPFPQIENIDWLSGKDAEINRYGIDLLKTILNSENRVFEPLQKNSLDLFMGGIFNPLELERVKQEYNFRKQTNNMDLVTFSKLHDQISWELIRKNVLSTEFLTTEDAEFVFQKFPEHFKTVSEYDQKLFRMNGILSGIPQKDRAFFELRKKVLESITPDKRKKSSRVTVDLFESDLVLSNFDWTTSIEKNYPSKEKHAKMSLAEIEVLQKYVQKTLSHPTSQQLSLLYMEVIRNELELQDEDLDRTQRLIEIIERMKTHKDIYLPNLDYAIENKLTVSLTDLIRKPMDITKEKPIAGGVKIVNHSQLSFVKSNMNNGIRHLCQIMKPYMELIPTAFCNSVDSFLKSRENAEAMSFFINDIVTEWINYDQNSRNFGNMGKAEQANKNTLHKLEEIKNRLTYLENYYNLPFYQKLTRRSYLKTLDSEFKRLEKYLHDYYDDPVQDNS